MPDQAVARDLLAAFGDGIAAPSANRFGRVSPTTADAVRAELDAEVDMILDDGPCAIGVESTIVDCTADPAVVLRPGGISLERLRLVVGEGIAVEHGGPSRAPGMLASHYAPRCRVELVEDEGAARARLAQLTAAGASAELLGMGTDAETYAHNLYAWLRGADDHMVDVVVAVLPSEEGIGQAVRDRLAKAAAARR